MQCAIGHFLSALASEPCTPAQARVFVVSEALRPFSRINYFKRNVSVVLLSDFSRLGHDEGTTHQHQGAANHHARAQGLCLGLRNRQ